MVSIAAELKSEREKRGVTLAQIAADTHISLRHLENLEEGRFGDLPGGLYNRAFLRAYCESLKLDQTGILDRYEQEVSPYSVRHSRILRPNRTGGVFLKVHPTLVWSLMLLVSATGIFLSRKRLAEIFSPYFTHSSARDESYKSLATPPADAQEAINSPNTQTPDDPQAPPALAKTANQTAVVSEDDSVPHPSGPSLKPIRLEIAATGRCWISIDRDGTPAARKLLNAGDVESFGAMEKLFIVLGNAGGVHLKVNGMSLRQLGKSGEVLRLVISEKTIRDLIDQTGG